MNLVLLRVEGDQARLDEIAERLDLHLDQRWTQGEADRRGARFRGSGYSATIADSQTPAEMIKHIREFVMLCRSTSTDFVGLRAELSVGVTVGDSENFAFHILRRSRIKKLWVPMLASPGTFAVCSEERSHLVVWRAHGEFKSVFDVRDWALGVLPRA